jgi:hypothetical protein
MFPRGRWPTDPLIFSLIWFDFKFNGPAWPVKKYRQQSPTIADNRRQRRPSGESVRRLARERPVPGFLSSFMVSASHEVAGCSRS